jgi:hypothetical protein
MALGDAFTLSHYSTHSFNWICAFYCTVEASFRVYTSYSGRNPQLGDGELSHMLKLPFAFDI